MKVSIIDFETTGLELTKDLPFEVGVVHYNEKWEVQGQWKSFMWDETYPEISKDAERVTGVSQETLKGYAKDPFTVLTEFFREIVDSQYVIAYNAKFDRSMLEAVCKHVSLEGVIPSEKWVCALKDVDYPTYITCKKLSHIAVEYGLTVFGDRLHRATTDCMMTAEVLKAGGHTIEQMVKYRDEPSLIIQANVSYDDRQLAKDMKYSWEKIDDLVFSKLWVKRIKASKLQEEETKAKFNIVVLEGSPHIANP